MDLQLLEKMTESVEREIQRTEYPKDFPALPPLPSARYHDPDFYGLEIEHIFKKQWLYAAHLSELPKLGSFKLFEHFGVSIIISRGTDDVVRAFRNVCRHRGAGIVTESRGTARLFVCPYHAWSYSCDGKLKGVPEAQNFAALDTKEMPLFQIRCETWRGFIFINFDDKAEPLSGFMAPVERQVDDFPLDELVVKDEIAVEIDCNWKVAYDNFLEIYHVNTVHAKSLAPYLNSKSFTVALLQNGHGRFLTRKPSRTTFFSDGKEEQEAPDFTARFKDFTVALPFFPNGFTALDPVGFSWQTFWPKGPDKCVMIATLVGWKRDDDEDRAFWKQMRQSQENVLAEDIFLFPTVHRAYKNGELTALTLSFQEQFIHWYNEEIDRRIGVENIPAALRVKQVLGPHVQD